MSKKTSTVLIFETIMFLEGLRYKTIITHLSKKKKKCGHRFPSE